MSKVGKRILSIPSGVTVNLTGNTLSIKGPLGELKKDFSPTIVINVTDKEITTTPKNDARQTKMLHGTTNSLINGMLIGVTQGFKKSLEIIGVGYNAKVSGQSIEFSLGYSHKIKHVLPPEIKATQEKPTDLTLTGIDKQLVGQHAATIKKYRKPEPYGGKGIRYKGEYIKKKAGKAAAK